MQDFSTCSIPAAQRSDVNSYNGIEEYFSCAFVALEKCVLAKSPQQYERGLKLSVKSLVIAGDASNVEHQFNLSGCFLFIFLLAGNEPFQQSEVLVIAPRECFDLMANHYVTDLGCVHKLCDQSVF